MEGNLINDNYIGVVVYNQDPDFTGRCKIRVYGIMDEIPEEYLPWFTPINGCVFSGMGNGVLSIPKIGSYVRVRFANGDIYSGEYYAIQNIDSALVEEIKDNYENTHVFGFDSDNDYYMMFQQSQVDENGNQLGKGFKIYYGDSVIQITPDSRVYFQTPDGDSIIELDGEDIKIVGGKTVTIAGATEVNVIGGNINLNGNTVNIGKDADEPAVLGSKLVSLLKGMCYSIQSKMPVTPGTPAPEMCDAILSNTVKVAK
jgi:hypothetical protein